LPAPVAVLGCKVLKDLRVLKVFPESLVPLDLKAPPALPGLLGLLEQPDLPDLSALPEQLDLPDLSD